MPGIYDSLEIGKRALIAHQAALNTIGHNLANAATPGYTRQRAELSPVLVQGGVEVSSIRRIRDRYLDFSLMTESQTLGQYQAQQGLLQRLQSIFNDPTTSGLGGTEKLLCVAQQLAIARLTPSASPSGVTVNGAATAVPATLSGTKL